ncbi:LOW QUALITY PROTEIN: mitochondrial inner membrane protease ATP23 homolog [Centruroides vittatus]|uniref:LOW QUALITY PROTEIN: mitochondrial inner membrane protease ATP23 homolog n=1 Tax=Centruroides vittatus TaxID=120091 RepID=UPI00350F9C2D
MAPSEKDVPAETKEENVSNRECSTDRYDLKHFPGRTNHMKNWLEGTLNANPTDRMKCEQRVCEVMEKSPLVKLMISALHSSGCDFDLKRHVVCEPCDDVVSGGYDAELNQVIICQNVAKSSGRVQGAMSHELIHMFDYCRANMDFKNLDHLACTEIRASNLLHCSFLGAVVDGVASPINIAKRHADCVKKRAIYSVLAVREVTYEEASKAVERVFAKCYNDLEPIGRRIRRKSLDMEKAYRERYHYGYVDP